VACIVGLEVVWFKLGQVNMSELITILAAELLLAVPAIIIWAVKPEFYSRILGKGIGPRAPAATENPIQRAEFDVKWLLSRVAQPFESFGHEDREGSDVASQLHVKQDGETIEFTGTMGCLKPSHAYEVEMGPSYLVGRPIPHDDIYWAFHRLGSLTSFTTDANGAYRWTTSVTLSQLKSYGISQSRVSLWIGDTSFANATVLMSENFGILTQDG
jgi:hypothetical protein